MPSHHKENTIICSNNDEAACILQCRSTRTTADQATPTSLYTCEIASVSPLWYPVQPQKQEHRTPLLTDYSSYFSTTMTANKKVSVVISEEMPLLERGRLGWLINSNHSELTKSDNDSTSSGNDVENSDMANRFFAELEASRREKVQLDSEKGVVPKKKKQHNAWFSKIDVGAFQFGLRMAVVLTFSSLFVLVHTDTWKYPDGR